MRDLAKKWHTATPSIRHRSPPISVARAWRPRILILGGEGPRRTGCVNRGICMIGCGRGAKNKLTKNYHYLSEKHGCVHDLHEVLEFASVDGGGYELIASHLGWAQRIAHIQMRRYTARPSGRRRAHLWSGEATAQYARADKLTVMSDQLGKLARTNFGRVARREYQHRASLHGVGSDFFALPPACYCRLTFRGGRVCKAPREQN